jgi:hypothetical protein
MDIIWDPNDTGFSPKAYIFEIFNSVDLVLQWILIFLQVLFARRLMLMLTTNDCQVYAKALNRLKLMKYHVIIASTIEAVLAMIYITLIFLLDKGVYKETDEGFTLSLRLLNAFATLFSMSVDFILYPMFMQVFWFFYQKYTIKEETRIYRKVMRTKGGSSRSKKQKLDLSLKKKLMLALITFLFVLNLVHSIYTHSYRILAAVNPYFFQ